MAQIDLSTNRNRLLGIEIRLVVVKGKGERWIGNLELVYANYYI